MHVSGTVGDPSNARALLGLITSVEGGSLEKIRSSCNAKGEGGQKLTSTLFEKIARPSCETV